MSLATEERAALCDLFEQLGPNEPTLCTGWQTRDLAAHLAIRERRPDAAPGILLNPLATYTKRIQDNYARRPWQELVNMIRNGPAPWWPTRIPALDNAVNSVEFFIHHEDTRRAQPNWQPRTPNTTRDTTLWTALRRTAFLTLRRSPVGLVLHRPDGQEIIVKRGPTTVTITGDPGELLLFATGREATQVDFTGDQPAIAAVKALTRGL